MKKKSSAALLALVLVSCAHQALDNPDQKMPTQLLWDDSLPKGSIQDDIQVLKVAIDRAYIGFKFVEKSLHNHILSQLNDLREKRSSLDEVSFCDKLAMIFNQVPDDHLHVYLGESNCSPRVFRLLV